jgi:hypothetical protein
MPWRAAAIVARLSWCRNDVDGDFARLIGKKHKVINRSRANRERHISSAAVFSVSSTPCFECLWNFKFP